MGRSASLDFMIWRFPVRVHWSFLLISLLLGLDIGNPILTVSWVLIVFVSIMAHELGHALVAESYGMFPSIQLHSMGGLTIPGRLQPLTHLQEILLSLAGPFAGFVLGAIAFAIAWFVPLPNGLVQVALSQFIWVNIGWGILNLVPMLPLDGGHVMRSVWQWISHRNDETSPLKISIGVGLLVVFAAIFFRQYYMAMLAAWLTYNNFSNLRGGRPMIY